MTDLQPIEGKTKRLVPFVCDLVTSKDDITAGDGAKHDVLPGKGALANAITCNVFEMLERNSVPTTFIKRVGDQFIARRASMVLFEVVVRNVATGSALKRNPELEDGHRYDEPEVEFFLKTTGKNYDGVDLPCDDPLAAILPDGRLGLYRPDKPVDGEPFHIISQPFGEGTYFKDLFFKLRRLALLVNIHLKAAWEKVGGDLWDYKIECGWVDDELRVADVIDFDSWRVFYNGKPVSKQLYRDDEPLEAVLKAMQLTKELTDGFVKH